MELTDGPEMANAMLVGVNGAYGGAEFVIATSPFVIGSCSEAHLRIQNDPLVSLIHAWVFVKFDELLLVDLGSAGGTRVNGELIMGPVRLRLGDILSIGSQQFRFEEVPA